MKDSGRSVRKTGRPFLFLSLFAALAFAASPAHAAFHEGGLTDEEVVSADALHEELFVRKEKILVLDARSKRSYDELHVAGAVQPLTDRYYRMEKAFAEGKIKTLPERPKELSKRMRGVPKDRRIVTYCNADCPSGAVLLYDLKRLGYADVRDMEEGLQGWQAKGYPVESKK